MNVKDKFMALVEPVPESGCWLWVGNTNEENGEITYGRFWHEGKYWLSHRFSFHLFKGGIPKNKMVLHKCDVRCCVNPEHLFVGTQSDNMQDMDAKGRRGKRLIPTGEDCHWSKISNSSVIDIRDKFAEGMSLGELAIMFNCSKAQICRIVNNKSRTKDAKKIKEKEGV